MTAVMAVLKSAWQHESDGLSLIVAPRDDHSWSQVKWCHGDIGTLNRKSFKAVTSISMLLQQSIHV